MCRVWCVSGHSGAAAVCDPIVHRGLLGLASSSLLLLSSLLSWEWKSVCDCVHVRYSIVYDYINIWNDILHKYSKSYMHMYIYISYIYTSNCVN